MQPYFIQTIVILFLSTAVIISCNKDKLPTSHSTSIILPPPPPVKGDTTTHDTIPYSDLSPVSDSDQVFYFLSSSSYPISCNSDYCTVRSRYILHGDGSFWLQYDYEKENNYHKGIQYKGWYTGANGDISFTWEGWSVAGPWGATANLKGDTLTVRYNQVMTFSDFEDAVYLHKR